MLQNCVCNYSRIIGMINRIIFLIIILILSGCNPPEQEIIIPAQKQPDNSKNLEKIDNSGDQSYVRNLSSVASDDIVLGNPKSKVIFIEYFSPTCPHCVNYNKTIFPEIKAKYIDTNKIAYVIREFIANKQDLDATILARCKGDIDNYLTFKSVILSKQENWAFSKNYREILTNIAGLGGVSPEQFAKCLNDQNKIKTLVENTKLAARTPNFAGTPSFFINGEQFNEKYTIEELCKAIDKHLIKIENSNNTVIQM